ncbi:MAG: TRL-like family protein [Leptospiraceae bacterium]|nr:TRL-like family protein [Leptospiraceae bacterium]
MDILFKRLLLAVLVLLFMVGCGSGFGPQGGLFSKTSIGVYATEVNAPKTGEACAFHVLGLVAVGDGSTESAALNGGISNIKSIDLESLSVLGLYGQLCTVVKGD